MWSPGSRPAEAKKKQRSQPKSQLRLTFDWRRLNFGRCFSELLWRPRPVWSRTTPGATGRRRHCGSSRRQASLWTQEDDLSHKRRPLVSRVGEELEVDLFEVFALWRPSGVCTGRVLKSGAIVPLMKPPAWAARTLLPFAPQDEAAVWNELQCHGDSATKSEPLQTVNNAVKV